MPNPRPKLIVDGFNLFIRHYCANPSMNSEGIHAGGVIGFLKALHSMIDQIYPESVYVVWEAGGSQRKRAIFPEYKANRRPLKLNRFYEGDIPDSEDNKMQQVIMLTRILKATPICQVYVEQCEADDVIAYLCKYAFKDQEKIIVSSDHDFYQLLDEKTKMFLPQKKAFFTFEDARMETGISPINFCTARCFCGDKSDNIHGVPNVGLKTLAKNFPELALDQFMSVDDIIDRSSEQLDSSRKVFRNIYESAEIARRNWKLMFLDTSTLSANQVQRIRFTLDTFDPQVNKITLLKALFDEGIQNMDVDRLHFTFSYILARVK